MVIYDFLYDAYRHFNKTLFSNVLPSKVVITIERRTNIKGYFSSSRFEVNGENINVSQITLNPSYFRSGEEKKVLSTLVHEMCHLYIDFKGKKGCYGYHSKEWSDLMEEVGLLPTSDGTKKGKKTGFRMTHLIIKGGKFEQECTKFLSEKKNFDVIENNESLKYAESELKKEKKSGIRVKYSCECSSVWGKSSLIIYCKKCGKQMKEIK